MPCLKRQLSFGSLHQVEGQLTFEAKDMFSSKVQKFRSLYRIKKNFVLVKKDESDSIVSCYGPMLSG